MTETSRTQKLHQILAEAIRTGDHETTTRIRRMLARQSGETYAEHYRRRWAEQQAIPADELV